MCDSAHRVLRLEDHYYKNILEHSGYAVINVSVLLHTQNNT